MSETTADTLALLPAATSPLARRRRLWREVKDQGFRQLMAVGGVAVIVAILLIFFYLLYVVIPLFRPTASETLFSYPVPGERTAETLYIATEEYGEVGFRLSDDGRALFFNLRDGAVLLEAKLDALKQRKATSFAAGQPGEGLLALGLEDGTAVILQPRYKVSYPNDKRSITPRLAFPFGEAPVKIDPKGRALKALSVQGNGDAAALAALTADQRLIFIRYSREESFLGEEKTMKEERSVLPLDLPHARQLLLGLDRTTLAIAMEGGYIDYYNLRAPTDPQILDHIAAVPQERTITDVRWLAGGISLLVGDSRGTVTQWFPVRNADNQQRLVRIRAFQLADQPITQVVPEHFRKGFAAIDAGGRVGLYHTTSERTLFVKPVSERALKAAAISPRAGELLMEDGAGTLHVWEVHNDHPEISWRALWDKVWYESRSRPEYTWQSSAANSDFEPKFSLTPLVFGTLKAALYAMLFAIPLSIMGAIYTGYFMSPRMRGYVKPTIELMGALPTVILGFLAGLWLAPLVEAKLPGIFLILLLLPVFVLACGYLWSRLPAPLRHRVPEGSEAALLVPVIVVTVAIAMGLSETVEEAFFAGNMPAWITQHLGLTFDQRNSLVVGIAMGFAVVPIIFSISEDAIFSVPRHLTVGSLALGATPWQTLVRVVLLTASPGIFSAIMIGLGRAVGETMIVLMATGNTPVVDFNVFQGFRALSANTAVEMPESEVGSTHYRILFLASLLLFAATFVFNTAAELVRQRLRAKYSNL